MALKSGIFNSVNGDRRYKAEDFASYFATFIGNGVFPNPSTGFQVTAGTGMTVVLKAGKAWINGYYIVNDADYSVTLTNANGILNRIDRVVLQYSTLNRIISVVVKKGTDASSPVAPTLQRDADMYELALADIYVTAGATSVIQANITDQRLNTTLCGIVNSTVNQVDTTTIFNQYQSWFNNMQIEKEDEFDNWMLTEQSDFDAWFQNVQNQLSTDAAGNLQNQINALDGEITTIQTGNTQQVKVKTGIVISTAGWVYDSTTDLQKYDIVDSDITSSTVVDINIKIADLDKARHLKSANESFQGYVRLYASVVPTQPITCDMKLIRQVF